MSSNRVKVSDLVVGDVFQYCGARYEITHMDDPDDDGLRLFRCTKTHLGRVICRRLRMVRNVDETFIKIS